MKQIKMRLEGLDCANCAAKLEREIAKIEGLSDVSINFMGEKLLFACEESMLEEKIREIKEVIDRVEPEASLIENEHKHADHHEHKHQDECCCGHEHHHHHDHDHDCKEDHPKDEEDGDHEHHHDHEDCCCGHEHHHHDGDEEQEKTGRYKFKIEGLDCANCAAKLEREIAKIEGLSDVSINFMGEKLLFACEESMLEERIKEIKEVIDRVEPEASLIENEHKHSNHHEHKHEGECCCGHEHHHHHDHDHDCKEDHHEEEEGGDHEHHHHHDHDGCCCGHDHEETDESQKIHSGAYRYTIKGLDCANCAAQLEREIAKIEHLENVRLTFMNETLSFDTKPQYLKDALVKIKATINRMEPDCTLEEKEPQKKAAAKKESHREEKLKIAGSVIFLAIAYFMSNRYLSVVCYMISYLLVGYSVLKTAVRNLGKGQWMDENFLMALATVGAIATGEFSEGVFVMLLYQIGELFQTMAVESSRRSISSLMDIRADEANVKVGERIERRDVEEVSVGEIIVIKPGEKVPLDGVVINGHSSLNTAALTGESLPRDVAEGDEVISGCVNVNGLLEVKVTKEAGESTVAKILDLVENASSRKASTENFITTFAKYYTPIVVALACIIAFICPFVIENAQFADYFHRGLIFLVVSCPCALVISVPLSYFAGIGGLSKKGILVKGSNYLDALQRVDTVVFDKTGTITKGEFFISEIEAKIDEDELLELAAYAESNSSHPISKAIVKAYGKAVDRKRILSVKETAGHGVEAVIDGKAVLAGNARLMAAHGIEVEKREVNGTAVYMSVDGQYAGIIVIADQIKPTSARAVAELKTIGIAKTVMLTGDNLTAANEIAKQCNINEVRSDLLPADKVAAFEQLSKTGHCAYVGDGINDAPVLAMADVGLAMGALGSDAAIEAADIVIMNDDLMLIADALKGAKKTRRIVMENIIFALGIKIAVLALSAIGLTGMGLAIFADVGVMLLAVLNAVRALN